MVISLIMVIILKHIEIPNHYVIQHYVNSWCIPGINIML